VRAQFFVGVAIGSLGFNNITSALYVVHVPLGSDRCVGPNCFFEALLLTALCVVACSVIVLGMLVLRSNCTRSRFPRSWVVQCCGRGLPSLGPQTTIDSLEKGLLQDA
jgi:RsiW-degrading membrane proteinase PrsW (M82 family)